LILCFTRTLNGYRPGRSAHDASFRQDKKNAEWKNPGKEVVYLIASPPASEAAPAAPLFTNRGHWGVEIMHRNKDVISGRGGLHQPRRQRAA